MVYCNKCKGEFEVSVRTRQLDRDIEEVFFNCPHCHERYTAYYSDSNIRKQQNRIRNLFKNKNKNKKVIEIMQSKLKTDMDNLMNRMQALKH